jgi:hypothetical protein
MWRYNSDGIDVCASRNVVIRDSFVRSFDDCFVARGVCLEDEVGPVENVTIENCVLWCDWGKNLEVWAGGRSCVIQNVLCRDCKLVNIDAYACDITTWGAPSNTVVRDIRFEYLEIDICRPRWDSRMETRENRAFSFSQRKACALFAVDVRSQNGARAQEAGPSAANVEYSNLNFSNFKVFDEIGCVWEGRLSAPPGIAVIRNSIVKGMPPGFRFGSRGNVNVVINP